MNRHQLCRSLLRSASIATLILVLAASTAVGSGYRTTSGSYFIPNLAHLDNPCEDHDVFPDHGLAGVCFNVLPGESQVDIRIQDLTTLPVSSYVFVYEEEGGWRQVFLPCGGGRLHLPDSAVRLSVAPNGVWSNCQAPSPFSLATAGVITATFS